MADAGKRETIVKMLGTLTLVKGKAMTEDMLLAYADYLEVYPLELLREAILLAAGDPDPFVPPVGGLVALMVRYLMGKPGDEGQPVLNGESAWKVAKRLISRYQPQTRTDPGLSGNPAVDEALRELGGARSLAWEGAEQEGYSKRAFLSAYEKAVLSTGHLRWALGGGQLAIPPPIVLGLESGETTRYAVLDNTTAPTPYPQITARARELTEDERSAVLAETKAGIARLVEAWGIPKHQEIRPSKVIFHQGRPVVVYDEGARQGVQDGDEQTTGTAGDQR